jgi:hypothetical protein
MTSPRRSAADSRADFMRKGRFLGAVLLMAGCSVTATMAQDVHYSPEERLGAIAGAVNATSAPAGFAGARDPGSRRQTALRRVGNGRKRRRR